MSREDNIELDGVVLDEAAGGHFRVKIVESDREVLAKLSGKMRHNKIKVVIGDKVRVAFSPYDSSMGLIVFRTK
jgi:translation initiation factor IF-1